MIVADAGPLIALARAGLLELLPTLLGQVVLPPAVFTEITIAPGKPDTISPTLSRRFSCSTSAGHDAKPSASGFRSRAHSRSTILRRAGET